MDLHGVISPQRGPDLSLKLPVPLSGLFMCLLGFRFGVFLVAFDILDEEVFECGQISAEIFSPAIVDPFLTEQLKLEGDTGPAASGLSKNRSADSGYGERSFAVRILPDLFGCMTHPLLYAEILTTLQTKVYHYGTLVEGYGPPAEDPLT